MPKKISKEVENKICEKYLNNISNKELSEQYLLNRTTIQRILKRNNIKLRKQVVTSRKYDIINFNGDIKNEHDSYILGLIYADGNLSRNCIDICLMEDDKEILEKISEYVYGFSNLSYRESKERILNDKKYISKPQYRLQISSKELCDKLRIIGLHENKSLSIRLPKLNKRHIKHFIRGYYDGDGCLSFNKKIKGNNMIRIISNPVFCEEMKNIIMNSLDINVTNTKKTHNVNNICITGNKQVNTFLSWLYEDSSIYLDRKFKKFDKLYNS